MKEVFDWQRGFIFSLLNQENYAEIWTSRHLSQMKSAYHDQRAVEKILGTEDPIIYEFHELGALIDSGDLAFGISKVYPGKIGNEYYMTKGHFHQVLKTAEIYFCLQGQGLLLIEGEAGDTRTLFMEPGNVVYVPKGYAHRSVNTGNEPLISFFAFRADAGHDYKTIETKGFRNLVLEQGEKTVLVPNPNWKKR